MGGSHGGSSTLATIVDIPENLRPDGARFAAAIALYPGCGRSVGGWSVTRSNDRHDVLGYSGVFKPLAPLLILIGELDDWTPPEPCRRLAAAAREAGYPVEIVVYPGAHHSFDGPARLLFLAERRNMQFPKRKGCDHRGQRARLNWRGNPGRNLPGRASGQAAGMTRRRVGVPCRITLRRACGW